MGSATTTPATIWCLPLKLLDVGLLPVQTKWRCQPFHNLDLALAPGARLPTAFEHDRIAIMSAQISQKFQQNGFWSTRLPPRWLLTGYTGSLEMGPGLVWSLPTKQCIENPISVLEEMRFAAFSGASFHS